MGGNSDVLKSTRFSYRDDEPHVSGFFSNVWHPAASLVTAYLGTDSSGKPIDQLISPRSYGLARLELNTELGTAYRKRKDGYFDETPALLSEEAKTAAAAFCYEKPLAGYEGDAVEEHAANCMKLEKLIGAAPKTGLNISYSRGYSVGGFVSYVSQEQDSVCLETKLRAPKYFLPDGFVINKKQFFDARIVSRLEKTSSGYNRSSVIADGEGQAVKEVKEQDQLMLMHRKNLKYLLDKTNAHYAKTGSEADDWGIQSAAEDFLESQRWSLSLVDYWDAKEKELRQSAEQIAAAILNKSPHRELVRGVVLYGSLARRDKIPGDIDLMLLVDSKDNILNPFNYFQLDDRQRPVRYNVSDVTNGIAHELGIMPQLFTIGTREESPWDLPGDDDKVGFISFSSLGGDLNLSVVTADFFSSPQLREQYMRLSFTPTYFRDVLTDGLAYSQGKFCIPTKETHAAAIESLDSQLETAKIQNWPNIKNTKPVKTRNI